MAAATATRLDPFEHHLDMSLEDFEPSIGSRSPGLPFGYPSAHSGFQSSSDVEEEEGMGSVLGEDDLASEASAGGYSPPAWRRLGNGDRSSGFWRKSSDFGGPGGGGYDSRESSLEYESADEGEILAQAIRTRLPAGSMSPDKERSPEPDEYYAAKQHPLDNDEEEEVKIKVEDETSARRATMALDRFKLSGGGVVPRPRKGSDNYLRFAVRADIQHRTEPIDAAINFFRSKFGIVFKSWASMVLTSLVGIMSYAAMRSLFEPASMRPVPDLVKVAGVAKSFEPLIYYSENGIQQVGDLQATGVAVWDLGESVRSSNLTSAPSIVKQLDDLSDSLKTLAIELTKFFANVDGDVDGILIVMDWARRELSQLQQLPSAPLSFIFDNIHNMLTNAGILENHSTGEPTPIGTVTSSIFGLSTPQRTKQTLQRTFHEFLAVLEEAISNELQHSLALFGLFEAIDRQFLNLARAVIREASLQDERHDDLLSSLWTRILGAKASDVNKYERNRLLLLNVRDKTVHNKVILVEHNHKLLALKANLEALRRKLVSPLVRSVNSSTLTLDEQIRGLEDVGVYLESVRARQKSKLLEMVYGGGGGGAGRVAIGDGSSFSEERANRFV
ncbi:hypothetical protein B0H63DRAFT_524327 [Podospora didyma]|uniref:Uncharacterized protein n=1 Tax=Podospora didyma TaxID=330526 RepID=A0AAE0TW65_9PEZI|nr:hypothetical protein B0H63DRAFT_524327 [Podospora didyma]